MSLAATAAVGKTTGSRSAPLATVAYPLFVLSTVASRIGVWAAGFPFPVVFLLSPLIVGFGVLRGGLKLVPLRAALFLGVLLALATSYVFGRPEWCSPQSALLLVLMYAPWIFVIPLTSSAYAGYVRRIAFCVAVFGLLALVQFIGQFVFKSQLWFSWKGIVPESLLIEFNTLNEMSYGSEIYKGNGFFLLEPSTLSGLIARVFLLVVIVIGDLRYAIPFTIGLLFAFSGTGVVFTILFTVPLIVLLLARRLPPALTFAAIAIGVLALVILVSGTSLGDYVTGRLTEFGDTRASGYARFTGTLYIFERHLSENLGAFLTGYGPGSFKFVTDASGEEVFGSGWIKLFVEYGLLGLVTFSAFFLYCVYTSTRSMHLALALLVQYLILDGGVLVPQLAFLSYAIFVLPARGADHEHKAVRMQMRLPAKVKAVASWCWARRIPLYLAYACLVLTVALVYWKTAQRTYEASALISVKPGLYSAETASTHTDAQADQATRSQVALLESESVIRQAVGAVGPSVMYPNQVPSGFLTRDDLAYMAARKGVSVRYEAQTDTIKASFRHVDPHVAVDFTRALVDQFTRRYFELYTNEKAVSFFWDQQKKAHDDYVKASNELAEFSSVNQIYNISEQQKLVLAQRSQLEVALQTTKGLIADKTAQADAIPGQLAQMKPVGRLPQVTGLTQGKTDSGKSSQPPIDHLASDPPLLLVRVYQDTIALLVRLQTDLAGLRALEAKQEEALRTQAEFLGVLSKREARFEQLRLAVDHARQNYEMFTQKAQERQLEQDQMAASLSSVQVVQPAMMPLQPVLPSLVPVAMLAMVLVLLPLGGAVIYHMATAGSPDPLRRSDPASARSAEGTILYHPARDQVAEVVHGRAQ